MKYAVTDTKIIDGQTFIYARADNKNAVIIETDNFHKIIEILEDFENNKRVSIELVSVNKGSEANHAT